MRNDAHECYRRVYSAPVFSASVSKAFKMSPVANFGYGSLSPFHKMDSAVVTEKATSSGVNVLNHRKWLMTVVFGHTEYDFKIVRLYVKPHNFKDAYQFHLEENFMHFYASRTLTCKT